VDVERPFSAMGLDSLRAVTLQGALERALGRTLSPTLFFNYPTVEGLAAHLAAEAGAVEDVRS
jgi:acyl carrier protein